MRKLILATPKPALAAQFAILVLFSARPLVAEEILTLTPDQLVGLLKKGQKIRLVLTSGAYAEAKVVDATSLHLEIQVRRSDSLGDLPKGKQVLSPDRVATVRTSICTGSKRKALPPLLAGLLAPSLPVTLKLKERWAFPAALATAGGAAVIGYYAGKASDCHPTTINVRHGGSASDSECADPTAAGVGIEPRE